MQGWQQQLGPLLVQLQVKLQHRQQQQQRHQQLQLRSVQGCSPPQGRGRVTPEQPVKDLAKDLMKRLVRVLEMGLVKGPEMGLVRGLLVLVLVTLHLCQLLGEQAEGLVAVKLPWRWGRPAGLWQSLFNKVRTPCQDTV